MQNRSLRQLFSDTLMKDVNLGILLIHLDFTLADISDTACRMFGLQREEVIGKSLEDVFAGVPVEHQPVRRAILDGVITKNHAISWTNEHGRFDLLMDSSVLNDHQGRRIGAYVIFKDVTNLRSLEEQVQRSDRLAMIGQIAAGTAHEIRNPLTSIKGFLQIFKKTLLEKGLEKEQRYVEIMLSEINRINDLVSEFLLLGKPKNTSYRFIDVSSVLEELMPIIQNEAILHGVQVHYRKADRLPEVVADRELMKQVFLNLCKNGIEAMEGNGGNLTITEKLEEQDVPYVCVEVQDTGPGIPPFVIDKIFDPFFTTKANGTGLGLAVCQRIIHDIGGTIRVSSKGFGTKVTVCIPYNQASGE
jgi:PAS domain S-box-containing protein